MVPELQSKVDDLETQIAEHEGHNLDAAAEHDELVSQFGESTITKG